MRNGFAAMIAAILLASALGGCIGGETGKDSGSGQTEKYAGPLPERLVGIDLLERIDMLPYLKFGTSARQVSSHDRSGANEDGAHSIYSFLRSEPLIYGLPTVPIPSPQPLPASPINKFNSIDFPCQYVVFDEDGPGCVYRIWMTDRQLTRDCQMMPYLPFVHTGNIQFFFDGESEPRIDIPLNTFFSGASEPFVKPIVGDSLDSSGGCYCYMPIPFSKSLKIVNTGPYPLSFYQITYHMYSDSDGVSTFDPDGTDISKLRDFWNNAGSDPKGARDNQHARGTARIAASGSLELAELSGGGRINGIKMRIKPNDLPALEKTWLRIYWDGESEPSVDAPVGEFFGCGLGECSVKSALFGMAPGGDYYSYFPMPFDRSAKIIMDNKGDSDVEVTYDVAFNNTKYDGLGAVCGYFHATHNAENPTGNGSDYNVLAVNGAGHYVGISSTFSSVGGVYGTFMEGDERVHFDGSRSPAIYGTGTEDYFNGGWYFINGCFTLPMHGNPAHAEDETNRFALYRIHPSDFMPFYSGFSFGIEHGGGNDDMGNYSSVAYWYGIGKQVLFQTDEMDIGNESSENAHGYVVNSPSWRGENTFQFEGDKDDMGVTEGGISFNGSSSFAINIAKENSGVRLRRLMDYGNADQKAQVCVDGELMPRLWYTAGSNAPHNTQYSEMSGGSVPNNEKRWLETDYEIPAKYTAGKDKLNIEIKCVDSSGGSWNEYRYWAYSYVIQ